MTSKVAVTNLDDGVLNNEAWVQRWAVGNTRFHQSRYDKFLDEREEEMFQGRKKSIFMPLCGKTFDILWMYERGHTVCGVEIAEQAIKELFQENKIDFEIEAIEGVGNLYKSKDGRLIMYVADLFDMSKELCGQYDVIWDRRSFVAINLADHQLYRDLLLSLMKDDGLYFLATVDYDPAVWPGPPHAIPDKVVKDVFGNHCSIALLEETNRTGLSINTPPGVSVPKDESGPKDESVPKVESVPKDENLTPTPKSAGEAIKTSSYVFDRWYKMTVKQH